jgi:hypothetical protein
MKKILLLASLLIQGCAGDYKNAPVKEGMPRDEIERELGFPIKNSVEDDGSVSAVYKDNIKITYDTDGKVRTAEYFS